MAVQAQHLSHPFKFMVDDAPMCGSAFQDEYTGCAPAAGVRDTTLLRDFPRSDLTACSYGFEPRKRARVSTDGFLEDQRVALPPAMLPGLQEVPVGDAPRRALASSSAASTSGRAANVAGVSSWLYRQGAEIDEVIRLESERMCAGLEVARRRHARALLAAAERAASGRLRAAEAELERAFRRNAELEDRARQAAAECQAWMGVARSHEAVATGLRATLEQLLQSPCAAAAVAGCEAGAEDAQSCCFEAPAVDANDDGAASGNRAAASSSSCKSCGGGEACVLLLPCRHLCLCRACEPAVHACPVCAATKNASLHVLLS